MTVRWVYYQSMSWPYAPTFARLSLALAIGLFVGIERERRGKEAGSRTFAFAALLGAVGGLLGDAYALLTIGLLGILVVLLNIETIRTGEGAEITTSAALLLTGFAGVLSGQGHTFTPTVLGVMTAALLAWKEPLSGFSRALVESELRSAVLLAILAFVIYPVLPVGSLDRWHLVEPRTAWLTVILIAALGFLNYVLLKIYGTRGVEVAGFFGGLVNSTVTVAELAQRVETSDRRLLDAAYRGVLFATAAMVLRNAIILGLFAPRALKQAAAGFLFMLSGIGGAIVLPTAAPSLSRDSDAMQANARLLTLVSPFSLTAAVQFGAIFLCLEAGETLAARFLGSGSFYVLSLLGGAVSSASAVASAATLSTAGTLTAETAGRGAILASLASAFVSAPIVARVGRNRTFTRRLTRMVLAIITLGAVGILLPIAGKAIMAHFGR